MILWIREKFDFVTISPLFLLLFLLATNFVKDNMAGLAIHKDIATYRYFSIPLIGFVLGLIVFLGILRKGWALPFRITKIFRQKTLGVVIIATGMFILFFSTILILRYTTFHTSSNELGGYDRKVWQIATELPYLKSFMTASTGHFQPILILHAIFYKINDSPVVLLILQVLTVASGVIPLYYIARDNFKKPVWIGTIVLLYLLYPAVGYNAIDDFHPDHFYIPFAFWAYYLASQKKYILSIIMVGIGGLAKEPLILGGCFWGLYLVVSKKNFKLGLIVSVLFFLFFVLVVFYIKPFLSNEIVLKESAFSHTYSILSDPIHFFNGVTQVFSRKVLFVYVLLFPFLFLPILSWKEFLPSIPFFIIPFMSTNPVHADFQSQYTAGIIAPALVALIFFLKKLYEIQGERCANATISFVTIMMLTFHFAQGPSFLSINFWSPKWSDTWSYKNYISGGEHDEVIREAISLIPKDKNKFVVTPWPINHKRLAHRYNFAVFPRRWEEADYIILDLKKPLMIGDRVDEEVYLKELQRIRNNPEFQLEFEEDGVLLFKRTVKDTAY